MIAGVTEFKGVASCILAVSLIVGCRSTPNPSADVLSSSAIAPVAASPAKPVIFTDKPELQVGTGPMDSSPPAEFSKTESGLGYRILRQSDGRRPTAADTVSVKYRGWLNNGKVFDSSYERGEPATFPLSGVVDGWTEGLQLVGVGGMIELWVPSSLGYGEHGSPGSVPAHATLHFIVELVSVQ